MKLTILKKSKYAGVYIYVYQYSTMFQYLFAYKGEIYQNHIFLKVGWRRKVASWFGYDLYSKQELEYGEQVMLSGAIKSLEALNNEMKTSDTVKNTAIEKIPVNK